MFTRSNLIVCMHAHTCINISIDAEMGTHANMYVSVYIYNLAVLNYTKLCLLLGFGGNQIWIRVE